MAMMYDGDLLPGTYRITHPRGGPINPQIEYSKNVAPLGETQYGEIVHVLEVRKDSKNWVVGRIFGMFEEKTADGCTWYREDGGWIWMRKADGLTWVEPVADELVLMLDVSEKEADSHGFHVNVQCSNTVGDELASVRVSLDQPVKTLWAAIKTELAIRTELRQRTIAFRTILHDGRTLSDGEVSLDVALGFSGSGTFEHTHCSESKSERPMTSKVHCSSPTALFRRTMRARLAGA